MAYRRRRRSQGSATRSAIRDEVRRVASDERDREEMRLIRQQLAELEPSRSDQTSNSA